MFNYSFWITLDYSVLDSDFVFIWIYLQNLGIRNRLKTCVDKYSEGQFGHKRYCNLDFL